MDNKIIDRLAVNALEHECLKYKSICIDAERGGCKPLYDGDIYVYKNTHQTNENLEGTVPIQIKGNEVMHFSGNTRTYQADLVALRFYMRNRGALFFVVELLDNGASTKIYYAVLQKYELQKSISHLPITQQTTSITLSVLPSTMISNIEYICRNYLMEEKLIIPKIYLDKHEIQRIVETATIGVSVIAPTQYYMEYVTQNPVYIYTVGAYGNEILLQKAQADCVKMRLNTRVCLDGKEYFDRVLHSYSQLEGHKLSFGDSIEIIEEKRTIKYHYSGTLRQVSNALEFILGLYASKRLTINGNDMGLQIVNTENNKDLFIKGSQEFELIQTVLFVLQHFGVKSDIHIEDMEEKDYEMSRQIAHLIRNEPSILSLDNHKLYRFTIGKVVFLGICIDEYLYNLFDTCLVERFSRTYIIDTFEGKEQHISATPFIKLEAEDYANVCNLDLDLVYKCIQINGVNLENAPIYNLMCLEQIKGFDMNPLKIDLLKMALVLLNQLMSVDPECDAYWINMMQIKHRLSTLTDEDLLQIQKKAAITDSLINKCAYYSITGDKLSFHNCFLSLEESERIEFRSWPIGKLSEGWESK